MSGSNRSPEELLKQIRDACDSVAETQETTYETGLKVVQSMINRLEKAKRKLAKSDSYAISLKACTAIINEKPHTTLSREFKELHNSVLHMGKTIDRNLTRAASAFEDANIADPTAFTPPAGPAFAPEELSKVIVHSLMRRGRFEVADTVTRELKLTSPVPASTRKAFEEMHVCCRALEARDVRPALRWAEEQERGAAQESGSSKAEKASSWVGLGGGKKSATNGSSSPEGLSPEHKAWNVHIKSQLRDLRFQLLKLRYLQLIQEDIIQPAAAVPVGKKPLSQQDNNGEYFQKQQPSAKHQRVGQFVRPIEFARSKFAEFAGERQRDIERLAGALLFAKDLMNSPYRDMYSQGTWQDVKIRFEAAFCRSHGFAGRDPLVVALLASNVALPKRAKYAAVMRTGKLLLDEKESAVPEVNLGKEMQFHSTFVCPISKAQSTRDNPPMLLTCGHVISQDALLKITRVRRSNKVKCPTCPVESITSSVTPIKF